LDGLKKLVVYPGLYLIPFSGGSKFYPLFFSVGSEKLPPEKLFLDLCISECAEQRNLFLPERA